MNTKSSKILLNVINLKSGGGLHILRKIMQATASEPIFDLYYVLVKCDFDEDPYRDAKNFIFIKTHSIFEISYLFFLREYFLIPYLTIRYKPDALFTFSDLPSFSTCRQFMFYDWAFATTNSKKIFKKYRIFPRFERTLKLVLFRLTCSVPYLYFCHLRCHAIELEKFSGRRVVHKFSYFDDFDDNVTGTIKAAQKSDLKFLIYPALPFPHKNFQLLANLVKKYDISGAGIRISLTVTYDEFTKLIESNESESDFLKLGIDFLGRLSKNQVMDYYVKSSALVFPSNIESLGIPLIEAMRSSLPILVSDLPYAREVCGDYAIYFDPESETSLYEAICKLRFVERDLLKQIYLRMCSENRTNSENEFSFFLRYIFKNTFSSR